MLFSSDLGLSTDSFSSSFLTSAIDINFYEPPGFYSDSEYSARFLIDFESPLTERKSILLISQFIKSNIIGNL